MDRLSVWKQNHTEVPIPSPRNPSPTPNPLIGLDMLVLRVFYNHQNPFVLDVGSIRTRPGHIEIFGCFHGSDCAAA